MENGAGSLDRPVPVNPEHYPGLFTTWERVTDWASGINETVDTRYHEQVRKSEEDDTTAEVHRVFLDGEPQLIPGPEGIQHVVCVLPKVGSSRWKRLFYKKHGQPLDPGQRLDPHHSHMSWLPPNVTHADLVANISDPSHLRFLWLRNPYTRLLSAFLDKGVLPLWEQDNGMRHYGAPFKPNPEDFLRFVKGVISMRADGNLRNVHFKLQAEQCGIKWGMQYDFHLKVEDLHVWYPDLISLFGLEDVVSSGWGHDSDANVPEGTPDCFFPLPGKSCELTDLVIAHHSESAAANHARGAHSKHSLLPGGAAQQAWMTAKTSKHAHNADTQLQKYYNTMEVVELATEFVKEDLEQFGYPEMRWTAGATGSSENAGTP